MLEIESADKMKRGHKTLEQSKYKKNQNNKGFVGKALIYDEEIFIDTNTGEGYALILKKMKSYIDWYSGEIRLAGFEREDVKQLIIMILLDGIRRYNPNIKIDEKPVRLSTFLYIHIKNRIISRIKEETKQSSNATYNMPTYKFTCSCGVSFITIKNDISNFICKSCKLKIDNTWTVRANRVEPISLDDLIQTTDENEVDKSSRIFYNGQSNSFFNFFGKVDEVTDFDRNLDFYNILKEEDEVTRKIANLIYLKDYSITDAAKEVGLTCWAASLRLKKLRNKKYIKDFFLNQ